MSGPIARATKGLTSTKNYRIHCLFPLSAVILMYIIACIRFQFNQTAETTLINNDFWMPFRTGRYKMEVSGKIYKITLDFCGTVSQERQR